MDIQEYKLYKAYSNLIDSYKNDGYKVKSERSDENHKATTLFHTSNINVITVGIIYSSRLLIVFKNLKVIKIQRFE